MRATPVSFNFKNQFGSLNEIDNIVNDVPVKIIKYTKNNKDYKLITDIKDYSIFNLLVLWTSIEKLSNIYWKRWTVETNFKEIKFKCSLNDQNVNSEVTLNNKIKTLQFIMLCLHCISSHKIKKHNEVQRTNN